MKNTSNCCSTSPALSPPGAPRAVAGEGAYITNKNIVL